MSYLFFKINISQYDVNIHEVAFLCLSPFTLISDIWGEARVEHCFLINSVNKILVIATIYRVLISIGTMLNVFPALSYLVLFLKPMQLVIIIPILQMRKLSLKEIK